jgi:hypothetical protein
VRSGTFTSCGAGAHSTATASVASSFYVTPTGSGVGGTLLQGRGGPAGHAMAGRQGAAGLDAMNGMALTADGDTIDVSVHAAENRAASPAPGSKNPSIRQHVAHHMPWLKGRNNHNGMSSQPLSMHYI